MSENLAWNTSKPDVMWCNVLCSWHGCHNPVRSSVQWAKSDSPLLRTSGEYCQWPKKSNKTHCSQTGNDIFFTLFLIKFIYSEKATKVDNISHLIWILLRKCQINWKVFLISFFAFPEYYDLIIRMNKKWK